MKVFCKIFLFCRCQEVQIIKHDSKYWILNILGKKLINEAINKEKKTENKHHNSRISCNKCNNLILDLKFLFAIFYDILM